jgi:hypothetical protein
LPDTGRRVIGRHNFWTKKNRQKIMKALIPVSPKKIGHYYDCKMDYPKITTSIKHNPNNIENQICRISISNNSKCCGIIHINPKIIKTQKNNLF